VHICTAPLRAQEIAVKPGAVYHRRLPIAAKRALSYSRVRPDPVRCSACGTGIMASELEAHRTRCPGVPVAGLVALPPAAPAATPAPVQNERRSEPGASGEESSHGPGVGKVLAEPLPNTGKGLAALR
jgi:hypothetical protein